MHLAQFKRNLQSWFEWEHEASYTQVQKKEPEFLTVLTVNTPWNSAASKESSLVALVFMWLMKLCDANGLDWGKKAVGKRVATNSSPITVCVCEHEQRMSECENGRSARMLYILLQCACSCWFRWFCELPVNNPNKSGDMLVRIVHVVSLLHTQCVTNDTHIHTLTVELYWRVNFQPCWWRRGWEEFEM